ncbi:MAG TPA: hypothetical protein VK509_16250, partial [Polyangiales bacterium]|nr:hypothetical protein [Polyangiales bacterium]
WTPHRGNPVKHDVTSARPGGNFFWHRGTLYRPAQDGSRHYGYGLAVCRVHELTPTRYEEEVVFRMYPEPGTRCAHGGYHTLAVGDGAIAIDGFHWATSPLELGVKLRRFLLRRRRNTRT